MTAAINLVPQTSLGVFLEPAQNQGRKPRWLEYVFSLELKLKKSGLPMWGLKKLAISSLPSRAHSLGLPAYHRSICAEIDDRRRDVLPLAVGDHLGPAVKIAIGYCRVGRSQVDSDEGGHQLLEPHPRTTKHAGCVKFTTHS